MKGLMQDVPLTITYLFERAEQYFGHKGIITATAAGRELRTYQEWAVRTRRLGGALDSLGPSLRMPGSAPSRGTRRVTSSCTSPPRAPAVSYTR